MTATLTERAPAGPSARASTTPAPFSLTVPRSVLREALGKLTALITAGKPSMPVLTCVRIDVVEAPLGGFASAVLFATDLDDAISLTIPVVATGKGRIAVPAKRLQEIVTNLPAASTVTLAVTGRTVKVTAGRSMFTLVGMDAAEFPAFTEIVSPGPITLPAGALLSALSRAVKLASTAEPRPIWNTVCLEVVDGALIAAATDGQMLGRVFVGLAADYPAGRQVLVRRTTIPTLLRLFGDLAPDAALTFTADEHQAQLVAGPAPTTIRFRLMDGPFPHYARFLAQPVVTHRIVCERDALTAAIKRVAVVATDPAQRVALTLTADGARELWLRASTADAGTGEDLVVLEEHSLPSDALSDADLRVVFQAPHLVSILDAIGGERVALTFNTATTPVLCRDADSTDPMSVTLLMPLNPGAQP
jgi:DNA polymerase-3 subunit beta